MALGCFVLAYLIQTPQSAPWLAPDQKQWLLETLHKERLLSSNVNGANGLPTLATANVWLLAAVYFGGNVCSYGMTLWLPIATKALTSSDVLMGFVTAMPYAAAALAMVFVGWHSDRTGERRWHVRPLRARSSATYS